MSPITENGLHSSTNADLMKTIIILRHASNPAFIELWSTLSSLCRHHKQYFVYKTHYKKKYPFRVQDFLFDRIPLNSSGSITSNLSNLNNESYIDTNVDDIMPEIRPIGPRSKPKPIVKDNPYMVKPVEPTSLTFKGSDGADWTLDKTGKRRV